MSIRLKRRAGILVAGVALVVATLLILPRVAEAQDTASVEGSQSASQPTTGLVVVDPGDSLWSISQERLHPNATPEQIANEVGRIYELNRARIGDDPDLILPGQELLLPPVVEPAAAAPTTTEPAVGVVEPAAVEQAPADPVDEPGALPGLPKVEAVPRASAIVEPSPESYVASERRLLGLGILVLTLVLAIITAWRMPMNRHVEDPSVWGIPGAYKYYENYALPGGPRDTAPTNERDPNLEEENNREQPRKPGADSEPDPEGVEDVPKEWRSTGSGGLR